jgi:hypothetical protein
MIIAFQTPVPEGEKTPEWIYDLLFSGIALFMTAPFVMIVGLCRKYINYYVSFFCCFQRLQRDSRIK